MNSHAHLDVSCFVALGDSITSGYADGALYFTGQTFSYANILAGQLKHIGCGNFRQPLMPENSVGVDPLGNARLSLKRGDDVLKNYVLDYFSAQGDLEALSNPIYNTQGPFNNMGVPGAKVTTLLAPGFGNPEHGSGNYNPFFTRMASNPITASMLSDVVLMRPTFFSLFIGNNDALAYALSGGTLNPITPLNGAPGIGFKESLVKIVSTLTNNGAKGVIASLPSIEFIPYFTCIPYNGVLLNYSQTSALNETFKNTAIRFSEGRNPFLVDDPVKGIRQLEMGELVLMDILLDSAKMDFVAAKQPLPKKYVLTLAELKKVQEAITGYNHVIQSLAIEKKLAFVDIHSLVMTARPDRFYNPVSYTLDYNRRGVFSLDGLHPNAFGQSIIANEFIKAINTTFGTEIAPVKIIQYPGLKFP